MKWNRVQLSTISELITKGTTPTSLGMAFSDNGIPFLRLQNLHRGNLMLNDVLFIDQRTDAALSRSRIRPGDVLLSIAGTIGRSAIVPPDAPPLNCNQALAIIRPSESISRRYLLQWLDTKDARRQMQGAQVTGTISNLSLTQVGNLQVPLPSLDEQRRIAAVLDKADELRENRRLAINKLDTLLQATFLEMFGDPVRNPKGWNIQALGKVCDVRDGTHDSPLYVQNGFPLVTSKNLTQGYVDLSDVKFISESDFIGVNKRSKVDRGDILMPMIGTIGNPVLVDHEPEYAIKNVALIKFREKSPSNIFIRQLLSGRYFNYVTARNNRGGTQKFISLGDIRNLPVLMPPSELQNLFAARVGQITKLSVKHGEFLRLSCDLFQSLQQRAFTGQLFPTN